jgi:4'-phosphopantetheinyl transferase
MIYWLVQTSLDLQEGLEGSDPLCILSPSEQERLHALRFEKRRREWLLGRWTAKRLLAGLAIQSGMSPLKFSEVVVKSSPSGVPFAQARVKGMDLPLPFTISISHCADRALCAAQPIPGCLGADIERVSPRASSFPQAYFTDDEAHQVEHTADRVRQAELVTAIWCAKEAALKAGGLGLTVDTRSVICCLPPHSFLSSTWQPFSFDWDQSMLPTRLPQGQGWLRLDHGFVLALAFLIQPALTLDGPQACSMDSRLPH